MKLFKYIFFILLTELMFQVKIEAVDAIITFFIKEKELEKKKVKNENDKFISESLIQPPFINAMSNDRSWLDQPGIDGLYASYLGYLTISDKNGQISFPRQQQSDTIHLLITTEIEPEFMMSPSLIHHWITKNNKPAAFYKIDRKKNKELKVYYFDVTKIDVPQEIPMNTITIYTDPDYINIPLGVSLNTYSTNFILPELQATKVNTIKNSLYTLSIKQYFEQINIESKNDVTSIATMVVNQ